MCALLSLGAIGACSAKPAEQSASPQASGGSQAAAAQAGVMPASAPAARTVTGTVLETMDASNYTYVRVKTDAGDVWAASGTLG